MEDGARTISFRAGPCERSCGRRHHRGSLPCVPRPIASALGRRLSTMNRSPPSVRNTPPPPNTGAVMFSDRIAGATAVPLSADCAERPTGGALRAFHQCAGQREEAASRSRRCAPAGYQTFPTTMAQQIRDRSCIPARQRDAPSMWASECGLDGSPACRTGHGHLSSFCALSVSALLWGSTPSRFFSLAASGPFPFPDFGHHLSLG